MINIDGTNDEILDTRRESIINKGDNESEQTPYLEWSKENEDILAEWCDIAQCYKWLNIKAHQTYSRLHAWFTIPAITLSTITGTASFAQTSLPANMQVYAPMVIGTINIMIGILTTVQQYLKISELNEAHRVAGISWDKFARNIRIELAKKLDERTEAGHMLKICRQEFDRLMETSPTIPNEIIIAFEKTFRHKDMKKPDIVGDSIVSVNIVRNKWYEELKNGNKYMNTIKNTVDKTESKKNEDFIREHSDQIIEIQNKLKTHIDSQETIIKEKQQEQQEQHKKHTEELRKQIEKTKHQKGKLTNYIQEFEKLYERIPEPHEIREHTEQNMNDEIDNDVLDNFLLDYNV